MGRVVEMMEKATSDIALDLGVFNLM